MKGVCDRKNLKENCKELEFHQNLKFWSLTSHAFIIFSLQNSHFIKERKTANLSFWFSWERSLHWKILCLHHWPCEDPEVNFNWFKFKQFLTKQYFIIFKKTLSIVNKIIAFIWRLFFVLIGSHLFILSV